MPKTLHLRLLLCISLGWIALLAITLLTVYDSEQELIAQTNRAHLEYEANLIARQIQGSIHQRQQALETLADRLTANVRRGAALNATALLASRADAPPLFTRLGIISPTGKVIARQPYQEGLLGLDVDHKLFFRQAMDLKRPTISDPFISELSGDPLVILTHPLTTPDGRSLGILIGAVNVSSSSFFDRIESVRIGNDGFASLMTDEGVMLSHPDRSLIMREADAVVPDSDLDLALLGWEGSGRGQQRNGAPALHAYAQVRVANWIVRVTMPLSQAVLPARHLQLKLLLIGLIATLAMLPLLWWLMRLALRPLHLLEGQIARIRDGHGSSVTLTTSMDEMQQLADTFNALEQDRRHTAEALTERSAFLDGVLKSSPIGIFITDRSGRLIYRNTALAQLTGRRAGALREEDVANHLHPDDQADFADLWQSAVDTGSDFRRQARYLSATGEIHWVEVQARGIWHQGTFHGYAGTVKDITQRLEEDAKKLWLAEHDPLTELLNRRGFERRLDELLADRRKTRKPAALLLFDLDHFKPVNDDGGHDLGDAMLTEVSMAMEEVFRRGDYLARPGGDEFAVLLPGCAMSDAHRLAERLRTAVSERRVMASDKAYAVTISLGMTEIRPEDHDRAQVIKRADDASYQAKREGRNRVVSATPV
ncbi:diguanylate cyclase [Halomonas sp. YLGW01]|uniref:sensor domain-containing diguanylate cyclase n=1 Tax=Halomonas sp. YLGW01 TaxID=2773308 RepID=UPI00177D1409|nr:diguanylate cyclase [Halomonas sp. YLGW01]